MMDIASEYDRLFESDKWRVEIPYIKFNSDWEVKIIPPSTGAIVRFLIKCDKSTVSVYLDCYDLLGYYRAPYWEVFSYRDNTFRCAMNDTKSLLKAIDISLRK
jgi:hypothetical protein